MKNRIYYHTYLDDYYYWTSIFTDQMTQMEKSGLFQNTEMLKVTAISTLKDNRFDIFQKMCRVYPVNVEIQFIESAYETDFDMLKDWSHLQGNAVKPVSETITLSKLYDDCKQEDVNVLYLHSKAVTAITNCLIKHGQASKFKNRHLWRQFMNWGVIQNWQNCIQSLNEYDTAGVDYQITPPHYKGNFWWSKSEHIRNLPDPRDDMWWTQFKASSSDHWIRNLANRFRDEFWICAKENTKAFNIRSNNGFYVENDI